MAEANTDRAILAASVGVCGALIAFPAGAIWWLMDFSFGLLSTPEPPDAGDKLFAYLVPPALLFAAGVPSTRFLGLGWRLTLASSAGVSAFISFMMVQVQYELQALSFGLIAAPGLLALIVAIKTGGDAAAIPALIVSTGLLTIAGVIALSAELFALAVLISLSGWVVLPAIAGLFQPVREEPEPDS